MKNKSKKIILVLGITIVLITLGVVLPIIVKGDNNDAGASQVLSGKTFTNGSAVGIVGTMKNFAGQTPTVTATVEASDEDYIATIDLDDGYYESVKINAKAVYDAGVTTGENNIKSSLKTKSITTNGTYNASSDSASGYSSVTVNVSGSSVIKKVGSYTGNQTINVSSYIKSGDTVNNFIIEFLGNDAKTSEYGSGTSHATYGGYVYSFTPSKSLSNNTLTVTMQGKGGLWTSGWGVLGNFGVPYKYNLWYVS